MIDRRSTQILLVEDNPDDVFAVQRWLEKSDRNYELRVAATLGEAQETFKQQRPDLILLDLTFEESTGLDSLYQVLSFADELPIVILTGYGDHRMALEAVRIGVEDYVIKNDITRSEHLTQAIDLAIERYRRKLAEHSIVAFENQMDLAQRIQQTLLPEAGEHYDRVCWGGRCEPAEQTGGDFYDLMRLPDASLAVMIADVSGHGLGPAMLMMETRAILRAMSLVCDDPGTILSVTNQILCQDIRLRYFATLFFGVFSPDRTVLRYASAGHPGYLLRSDCQPRPLTSNDPPLGVVTEQTYSTAAIDSIAVASTLLLFTDGVLDFLSDNTEECTFVRAVELANEHAGGTVAEMLDVLFANIDCHDGKRDDCSALLVRTA